MKPNVARASATRLLTNVNVARAIAEGIRKVFGKIEVTFESNMADLEYVKEQVMHNPKRFNPFAAKAIIELQGKYLGFLKADTPSEGGTSESKILILPENHREDGKRKIEPLIKKKLKGRK